MVNTKLLEVATPEKLIEMGFVEEHDGTSDPRGTDWNIRTKHFHLLIDAWREVQICRLKPDTDFITLHVEDLIDLQAVVDWVLDENNKIKKEEKKYYSNNELLAEFKKLDDRQTAIVLNDALDYMEEYNGRSKFTCIMMAMGYENTHEEPDRWTKK